MRKIQYKKLDADCFNAHSLDSFVRHQAVTECWREVDLTGYENKKNGLIAK